jgi:hypothetical protein
LDFWRAYYSSKLAISIRLNGVERMTTSVGNNKDKQEKI